MDSWRAARFPELPRSEEHTSELQSPCNPRMPSSAWWLTVATIGFVFLPTRDWRLRLWVPFWLLVLMYGVFKKLNNLFFFLYPGPPPMPLMSPGLAGVL